MHLTLSDKKELASEWFEEIRTQICNEFEAIEREMGFDSKFERKVWSRDGGGGGIMAVMNGGVFEKVGVNVSTVYGEFDPKFAKEIPGAEIDPTYWASGVSLVAHMKSPLVPSIHMNTRMIVTTRQWFGGGTDLTPTFEFAEDNADFFAALKAACDAYDPDCFASFKKHCDEYFFLPHRNEARGIGGIFYDYQNSGAWESDFKFTQDVGRAFLEVFPKLVRRRMNMEWTQEQKYAQLIKRGRYAEFNLLYDRGTRFGLMTGGNTDAILMSLPPEAAWAA